MIDFDDEMTCDWTDGTWPTDCGMYSFRNSYTDRPWPMRDGMYQHYSNWGDEPPCTWSCAWDGVRAVPGSAQTAAASGWAAVLWP